MKYAGQTELHVTVMTSQAAYSKMKITLVNANWLTQVWDWLTTSLAGKLTTKK